MNERRHENAPVPEGAEEQAGSQEARLVFGMPGHEDEYVLRLEGYDTKNFIPPGIEQRLKDTLGELYIVMNRGTRIEIIPVEPDGRNDAVVSSIVRDALQDLPEWLLVDGKKFKLETPSEEKEGN